MTIGTTFVDSMDLDRHVRPTKDLGNEYECEVFWHGGGRSVAGGRTRISKRLFDPACTVGFRPWVPEQERSEDAFDHAHDRDRDRERSR